MRLNAKETAREPDTCLAFVDQLASETRDRRFLRDQILNAFFPARDSAAIGASCLFFLMARHPSVWTKLRASVSHIQGSITYETLKSCKYLSWVLYECETPLFPNAQTTAIKPIRLSTIVAFNRALRTCLADCVLPMGRGPNGTCSILIQKGTVIDMDFGLMQQDKDLWGPDADEFRPERWENLNPKWSYIPFLAGPRVRPAQQMVLTQHGYLLVRFVQRFESIANADKEYRFVEEHRMTKQVRNVVQVKLFAAIN